MNKVKKNVVIYNKNNKEKANIFLLESENINEDVEIILALSDYKEYRKSGRDFFSTLLDLRELLDTQDITIAINGCRYDFNCSSMSIQMSRGMVGYILEIGKKGSHKVRTFDTCENRVKLATVDKQMEYYKRWVDSPKN